MEKADKQMRTIVPQKLKPNESILHTHKQQHQCMPASFHWMLSHVYMLSWAKEYS